jgi:hypothetical protein
MFHFSLLAPLVDCYLKRRIFPGTGFSIATYYAAVCATFTTIIATVKKSAFSACNMEIIQQ